VSAGRGPKGDGFTGGSYESSTGVVTFTSNDGIGFSTGDLRGDLSEPGPIGDVTPAAISGTTGTFSGDFTVDTDTLYVDSANNQVGIGTSSPGSALQVEGQITGTAVQQYPTDSTLSRVLLNRAHGLGASSAVQSVNDFSAVPIIPTGFYRTGANLNNVTNPPPNSAYEKSVGMVMRGFAGGAGILHMYSGDDGQPLRAWVGAKASDGDAVSWAELFTNESIVGTVSQSGGTPTGAVIERGSNANGEYVRFADGTQICTHRQTSSSSSNATWTYPAAAAKTDCLQISPTSMTGVNVPAIAPSTAGSAIFTLRDALDFGARVEADVWLFAMGRWF